MEWNVFVVKQGTRPVSYLVPLSDDVVFRMGLVPQAIAGEVAESSEHVMHGSGGIDHARFKPTPEFLRYLHAFLGNEIGRCPSVLEDARRKKTGNTKIVDGRTPKPSGDVPAEDTIGVVLIENSKPVAYKPNTSYRVYDRHGMMVLDPWLEERYLAALVELLRRK
jgi:hypothetical protein